MRIVMEMEPLSSRTRRGYLILLVFIFFVLVPITLLYSSGYRIGEDFKLVKTGGIFIGINESSAELFLDGKSVKRVGILKSGFFVQDLTPRVYHVVVEKEGFRRWEKILEVLPQRVSETSGFILPETIPYELLDPLSARYESTEELFATSTATRVSRDEYPEELTTPAREVVVEEVKRKGDVVLWREGTDVFARWVDGDNNAPSYFCDTAGCDKEIQLNKKPVTYFDFHPQSNELLIFIIDDVVMMTEIDPRIPRNIQTLFQAENVAVRTQGSSIFVREPTNEGVKIFEYEL